jgi:hypothetical protein
VEKVLAGMTTTSEVERVTMRPEAEESLLKEASALDIE